MRNIEKLEIGARVRVIPQHWLRGGDAGEVIGFERRGRNNWLVQFDIRYPGGGIDGDKLWLDQSELSEMTDNDVHAHRPHRTDDAHERSTAVDNPSESFRRNFAAERREDPEQKNASSRKPTRR